MQSDRRIAVRGSKGDGVTNARTGFLERMIVRAIRRMYQRIDRRVEHAKGEISDETLHRSLGQLNRDREAEKQRDYREASIRG